MINNFETIIGIEIHLELNTKTKMFSPAPNIFNAKPNTLVHPIDIAYPGTLPRLNKETVIKAIKLAKALNMEINTLISFDRKNYFYPDLPKGFQITQQKNPIGKNGNLIILSKNKKTNILIERIHLEEDTAKQIHLKDKTLLDFNRAGVPLIEIVTKPVIKNADEAMLYVDMIKKIALCLNISDAKMDEGSLRADINISIRPYGQKKFGTKVEIKNINSISNIKKAIEFEKNFQIQRILDNKKIMQQTKRFDDTKNETIVMRNKIGVVDYKYMAEPNITPIELDNEFIKNIKIEKLPWEIQDELKNQNIKNEYVQQFLNDFNILRIFNKINYKDKEKLAKVFFSEIISLSNSKNIHVKDLDFDYSKLVKALVLLDKGKISGKHLKTIILKIYETKKDIETIIKENNMILISDENILKTHILKALKLQNYIIDEYYTKPEKVMKFIIGYVMKATKGQANPVFTSDLTKKIIEKKLKKV